jgi:hypothetical protein
MFCTQETEYLGYVLTRTGIKSQPKKVQEILTLKPLTGDKDLHRFLGMAQYYQDLWEKISKMVAPLTSLARQCGHTRVTIAWNTKNVPWHWDEVDQKVCDDVKAVITNDVALAYHDYSKAFEIYTDASSRQMGAGITQQNRPIALFSRKLSAAQQKYSVAGIILFAIVETLKEFKGMLWGQLIIIKVYTDHKNLIQDALGLASDSVYHWRLLLREYGPEIRHIKVIHNTVADAISHLDYGPVHNNRETWMTFTQYWCHYILHTIPQQPAIHLHEFGVAMNVIL